MTIETPIDGRRQRELEAEFLRRAAVELTGDGRQLPVGTVAAAFFDAAARIGEEVTRRLDKVPDKQLANFLTEARLGRDPARPATVPISIVLADTSTGGGKALAGTRLSASGDGEPVIFETVEDITLAGGRIVAVRGVDAVNDSIGLPSDLFTGSEPQPASVSRRVKSGAGTGAEKLQIGPGGLVPGLIIRIGSAVDAPQYKVTKVEGDLIGIDPALEQSVAEQTPVTTVTTFAPFAPGTRNRQRHVLYLGHETLFDVPSAVVLKVRGLNLPEGTVWHWWGTLEGNAKPDWQLFDDDSSSGALELEKPKGKTMMTQVRGQQKFWLRATLPGPSNAAVRGTDIRVAVATNGLCNVGPGKACSLPENGPALEVDFEAIANTTPVVPNKPFHPFGREPRLFDTFYVGCAEALSKPGASITLCFELGGPELGALTAVRVGAETQVFGIGTDNLVYRVRIADKTVSRLEQLPPIPEAVGQVATRNTIAAAVYGNSLLHVVVAGTGGVYRFAAAATTAALESGTWQRLDGDDLMQKFEKVALVGRGNIEPDVYGLAAGKLYTWPQSVRVAKGVAGEDLLVADDGTVVVVTDDDPLSLTVKPPGAVDIPIDDPESLQPADRAVWHSARHNRLFIAARTAKTADPADVRQLTVLGFNLVNGAEILDVTMSDPGEGLPIGFVAPGEGDPAYPDLIFATATPKRLHWLTGAGEYVLFDDVASIGLSGNGDRRFLDAGDRSVVQRDDFGLIYRPAPDGSWSIHQFHGARRLFIEKADDETRYVVFGNSDSGSGFSTGFANADETSYLIAPFGRPSGPLPLADGTGHLYAETTEDGVATRIANKPKIVQLPGMTHAANPPAAPEPAIVVAFKRAGATVNDPPTPAGIWQLTPSYDGEDLWQNASALPVTFNQPDLRFVVLKEQNATSPAHEALALDVVAPGAQFPLRAVEDETQEIAEPRKFGGELILAIDYNLLEAGDFALLRGTPQPWTPVGPTQPVNPTLSWEYWNGRAWWALDGHDLNDETANLLLSSGVRFTVPPDLAPTEVGGKRNHWVRARLIGGEYGQARLTVKTTEVPGAKPPTSTQEIDRDITAIRAPYVAKLRVGYCAETFVLPEVVLTEDSLGARNQTSANTEGQPVEIFTPVWALMNPGREQPSGEGGDGCETCGQPPKAEPLRCDPCAQPQDPPPAPVPLTESPQVDRAVMVGLSRPPRGERITLFADVEPQGAEGVIAVEVLHKGGFRKLDAIDGTHGLTEPGIIAFPLDFGFDQADLMNSDSFWLRLRPEGSALHWSPVLRGLHLNAATARSAQTRELAGLGASSGIPDQTLVLAQPPIEVGSLELFVRERLTEAEREAFPSDAVVSDIQGLEGPWVRWSERADLGASASTDRHYTLDPETGTVQFGDGVHGAIPPLGADVVARKYRRVSGDRANALVAGAELQLVSPIAGVERVVALDRAAGGADAETNDAALRRAPAKLRRGSRIHTLADLEDVAVASGPEVAQARASLWHGGVRLVVALAGENPVPYPARLRALASELTGQASFGLARPQGLTVVGPRPLPVYFRVVLTPDDLRLFPSIADEAKTALKSFLDVATGGVNGRGWPIGAAPRPDDLAAALYKVADRAVIASITLLREGGRAYPETIAPDRLVTYGDAAIELAPQLMEAAE